jgi:hypothetical protein
VDRRLVKTGGRLVKHARYYLLAVDGEPPDETVVWQYARADRRTAASGGIAGAAVAGKSVQSQEGRGV